MIVSTHAVGAQPALKDAFQTKFLIGAAVNESQFTGRNAAQSALVKNQFNTITPENDLKWERVHPAPGHFNFEAADHYVAFGETNQMFIVGHNLIWHNQTPAWVFQDATGQPLGRDALLARMREHILTVAGRYQGRIHGWDVVNEAVAEDGSLRATPWLKIIGEDYLLKAYQFAHEADPAAELYYNDYDLENPAKRAGAIALVKKLQAQGVKISGVGIQGHYHLNRPTAEKVDATITDIAKLGVKVMITELDVDVLPSARDSLSAEVTQKFQGEARLNPFAQGLPDEMQAKLAARYAELFAVFLQHRDVVKRVTFWGVTDGDSWLNGWPVAGRTSYPLLFDRAGKPKPAFTSVVSLAQKSARATSGMMDDSAVHADVLPTK